MYVRSTVIYQRDRARARERVRLVVALCSTVLEYVHRRVSLSLCCSGSFGLANRATMLLARVNGEQEISLQPVAQVWVTHIVSTERVACFVVQNKLYVKWESPDKKNQETENWKTKKTETDPQSDPANSVWTKVLWKVATCNCHVQLKSHLRYKKQPENPTEPDIEHRKRTQGKSGRKNAPTLESQFTFSFLLFSVFFAHLPVSHAISLTHSCDPSAEFMRCVLHYFDFLQFRAKRTRTFIFYMGAKKLSKYFFSHFYDTTSSRSENMIFLAIMTSCKP